MIPKTLEEQLNNGWLTDEEYERLKSKEVPWSEAHGATQDEEGDWQV